MNKILNNKHFKTILHIIFGVGFGYLLTLTFYGISFAIQLFLTVFVVGGLSIFWKWLMKAFKGTDFKYQDVLKAVIPAIIVVILSHFL
ncbi:MAG TPA: hypothetical protein PLL09_04695 [Flavobacterium sp.]|uniref:hypothetical protein n=1 Tax=unclassified Flavobacterium TaxID=196869 RepID=UPI0025C49D34|nr:MULTISPECIES: hypothetical protein [unclassified Flavobacterium]HRE77107.1 hypothetical protein [Flavobacterium sp.]